MFKNMTSLVNLGEGRNSCKITVENMATELEHRNRKRYVHVQEYHRKENDITCDFQGMCCGHRAMYFSAAGFVCLGTVLSDGAKFCM